MSLTVYIKDKSTQTKSGLSGHTSDRVYSRGLQWSWKNHKMLPEAKFKSTSTKVHKKILGAQQEIMGFTMPVAHIRAGVVEEDDGGEPGCDPAPASAPSIACCSVGESAGCAFSFSGGSCTAGSPKSCVAGSAGRCASGSAGSCAGKTRSFSEYAP